MGQTGSLKKNKKYIEQNLNEKTKWKPTAIKISGSENKLSELGWGEWVTTKGTGEFFDKVELLYILIVMVVTQLYEFFKTHRTVY